MTMTLLTYTVLTDPAPLEASRAGQSRSPGTVYLMVTNTGSTAAYWSENEVSVSLGDGAEHLTPDITSIKATSEYRDLRAGVRTLSVLPQVAAGSFQVTDPAGGRIRFAPGEYLVLKLADIPVAETAGLTVLRVKETASRQQSAKLTNTVAAVPLLKTAAEQAAVPSNFRPDQAMVDDGDTIVLRWDGSTDLAYTIGLPDGSTAPVTTAGEWKPAPGTGPKRDTTYTLIATNPHTMQRHFLTTTVQLRTPTFETGLHASQIQGTAASTGNLGFTSDGVQVSNNSGVQAIVRADRIVADLVSATRVQGANQVDGSITFPEAGIQVCNGRYDTPRGGHVFAEYGIYRNQYFAGEDDNRWIDLSDGGRVSVKHRHKDGTTTYGTLAVSDIEIDNARY
ncbi:hypothetical protein [Nocardia sp. NPDC003963]